MDDEKEGVIQEVMRNISHPILPHPMLAHLLKSMEWLPASKPARY